MRLQFSVLTTALALLMLSPAALASTFDIDCNRSDLVVPLRQTLIVLDENEVTPEPNAVALAANMAWRRFLGRLLLSDDNVLAQAFEPREHVTLLIARKDGTGTRTIFEGCVPFYSVAEMRQIKARGGVGADVGEFFGSGPVQDMKKDLEQFRLHLGQSVQDALLPDQLSPSGRGLPIRSLDDNSLIVSLNQGSIINPAYGVPRILFYSDMSRYLRGASGNTVGAARAAGEAAGFKANLDLGGAEVYLIGMSGSTLARDTLTMFFLASHGELMSSGPADVLPRFMPSPSHVARYQGFIVYPKMKFPIRVRIATDRNGTVVNSWLSVHADTELFAPIHGIVTCARDTPCIYTGDDLFAQVWNPDRDSSRNPRLQSDLPFGGARDLDMRFDGNGMRGSISDPQIQFTGLKDSKLEFTAARQINATF